MRDGSDFEEMTPEDVSRWVRRIDGMIKIDDDNEGAHIQEEALYKTVMEHIAAGTCIDPQACAREALKTRLITFHRWFG